MRVLYLALPRFPVQRRVVEQPSLAGRPLVLFADERGSKRVRFTSGAALRRGVRPGMTVSSALALEPSLLELRDEPAAEARALGALGEALLSLAPGFQVDAPEGLWLDASAAPLSGGEEAWAERVLAACRGLGLRGRCAVGAERFTTQAVARWGEAARAVLPARGGPALSRLPLSALERGWLGDDATAPFRALGLSTLGELAGLPSGALVGRFGAAGLWAARLCRGEDDSRFVADPLPEVLEEAVQLDWPAEALAPVLFALKMLIDRLCARLQGRQRAAVRLTVTVLLDGGAPLAVPLVLARPSAQAKLLLELVRHRLTDLTVRHPITALHLRVDEAGEEPGRQLALGGAPVGEAELEVVLSRLQSALGEDVLFCAAPLALHRPEAAWAKQRFSPPAGGVDPLRRSELVGEAEVEPDDGALWGDPEALAPREVAGTSVAPVERAESVAISAVEAPEEAPEAHAPGEWPVKKPWPRRKAKVEQQPALSREVLEARPPRLFREPSRLHAELSLDGALVAVTLAGRRRKVEALTGPERLAGGWWSPEPFSRDYYRLQLEGVGQLWIFRDGKDGAFYAQGVFD